MQKTLIATTALLLVLQSSCKKSADTASQISLTASATEVSVGQTVSVTVNASANAARWSVSPGTATQSYTTSTSKVNNFIFNQPGQYTVSVRTKSIGNSYSSQRSMDSVFNTTGSSSCVKGIDSTSLKISVLK